MFDSHCHLNFKAFADDASQVAADMQQQGLNSLIVGCDAASSEAAVKLGQEFPNLWSAVGHHPTHVFDTQWDDVRMAELASQERVVAIGEVGLDFFRFPDEADQKQPYIDEQYRVFRRAIALAVASHKPLVVHSRQAYDELITVLKEYFQPVSSDEQTGKNGTIHCFMGDWSQAQQLLELDFMLGFTGVITYKNTEPSLLEVVDNVPLDRLLIETDAPYLTPEPYRGEGRKQTGKTPRNLPQYVEAVAQFIADRRQKTINQIIQITEDNAKRLFRIA